MLDGQKKFDAALEMFEKVAAGARTDSYLKMDASYEVARLNLVLWLISNKLERKSKYLDSSIAGFYLWTETEWSRLSTKIWGYYHLSCALKEKLAISGASDDKLNQEFERSKQRFSQSAGLLKGSYRYSLLLTAFLFGLDKYDHNPGEPIKCGLNELFLNFRF